MDPFLENTKSRTIDTVDDVVELQKEVLDTKSSQGSGGMKSKIEAAAILQKNHIESWFVNGLEENFILNAMYNKSKFTKIK